MQEQKEKYNISETFFDRYFDQNAQNRFGVDLSNFMWFKKGKFLNPQKKDFYLNEFLKEEIISFYEKNEFHIPQVEFNITTKCSLKCKDCCALIPHFNKNGHIDLTFEEFKIQLDKLLDNVTSIRHLILLGGEPLLNKELPQMLDYACKKENIDIIRITTNGTMLPKNDLLEIFKANPNRAYFYLSNYSKSPDLEKILKYEELKQILKENNIKFQMVDSWNWLSEKGMSKVAFDDKTTKEKVKTCYRIKCSQILNGKFDVCSKALGARELGLLETKDYIDILQSKNLRQDLIKFYQKEIPEACKYCILSDKTVQPALQL